MTDASGDDSPADAGEGTTDSGTSFLGSLSAVSVAKYVGIGVLVLGILVGAGFLLGFVGVPTVEAVENRFDSVNDTTTTIDTNLVINNPNPIGISLGDTSVDYTVLMNEVQMANGSKHGLSIGSGNSSIAFESYMDNGNIPRWWYTHITNGETTEVLVDADVSVGLLGGKTISLPQRQTIETDIVGQFNDSTTRSVDADVPLVSDPVLYINETQATIGSNVTLERTPLDMAFTVYNPKSYPYTVSKVGYEIRMNDVTVGEGATEQGYTIPGNTEKTLETTTVIKNENLDDWWVSHLERDQVTNLTIDFYFLVDTGSGEPFRIDTDKLDHHTTIETDIFGTKASDGLEAGTDDTDTSSDGENASDDGTSEEATPTATPDSTAEATATITATATPTPTPTPTSTDDGII
ncbi:LEA type 2 family protein [Halobacteriales archaeon Cl-PHB]